MSEFKVVIDNGQPLVVYHDAQWPDRIGNEFRAERATGGPMQLFADDGVNAPELGAFLKPLEELNAKHVDDGNPVDARGRAVIAVVLPAFAEITRPGENRFARTAALESEKLVSGDTFSLSSGDAMDHWETATRDLDDIRMISLSTDARGGRSH